MADVRSPSNLDYGEFQWSAYSRQPSLAEQGVKERHRTGGIYALLRLNITEMVQIVFDQEELVVVGDEGSHHVACRFEMSGSGMPTQTRILHFPYTSPAPIMIIGNTEFILA